MNTLTLYLDCSSKRLIRSGTNDAPFALPTLYQGDVIPVVVYLVEADPSGGIIAPYSYVDDANVSLKFGLVTPAASSPTVHASADLAYVSGSSPARYAGTLTMGSGITSLLGSATSASCKLEIQVTDAATAAVTTVLQIAATVAADGIKAGVAPADPAPDRYMVQSEILSTFTKRNGLPGESITLTSTNGLYAVTLYVDDSGVLHQDVVTL